MADSVSIGYPLRQWQRECASGAAQKRFAVLVLHRRAGKTELALQRLNDSAIRNTQESPLYFYIAPLLKQAKTIAWTRLKQMIQPLQAAGAVEVSEAELYVKYLHNGAIVRLYGADNPDAMRGVRLDGCAVDEVAQIKPEVWIEILRPALSDRLGWAWFLGTPKGINLFSDLYFAAGERVDWYSAKYTVYDTDALSRQEIDLLRREMSEQAFKREMLCDFEASGDDQLISLADVELASKREYKPHSFDDMPVILGVDVARYGADRSVIYRRQGLQVYDPIVYRGAGNMELAGYVAAQIDLHNPDAVFVDAGQGSGVIDRLRQLGYNVIEVNFGGKSTEARFVNKRTEMWYNLADAIRSGLSIPARQGLKIELATPTYTHTEQGQIKLEGKDEIKKRMPSGESPDEADALALTYAFPVQKKPLYNIQSQKRKLDEYDPLSNMSRSGQHGLYS